MKNLFEHTSAPWIRYSTYEYKTGTDNKLYITVSKDARPEMYRPMLEAEQLVMVQMCFSFMLTDKDSGMRMCKHCNRAFVASRKGNEFCSQKCKNPFNVYKSREKKKGNKRDD